MTPPRKGGGSPSRAWSVSGSTWSTAPGVSPQRRVCPEGSPRAALGRRGHWETNRRGPTGEPGGAGLQAGGLVLLPCLLGSDPYPSPADKATQPERDSRAAPGWRVPPGQLSNCSSAELKLPDFWIRKRLSTPPSPTKALRLLPAPQTSSGKISPGPPATVRPTWEPAPMQRRVGSWAASSPSGQTGIGLPEEPLEAGASPRGPVHARSARSRSTQHGGGSAEQGEG